MATLIKQFTFVAATNILPNEVNANFDDIITFVNNSVVHVDGTRAMTGGLTLPAADPTSDNQASRKAYVDARDTAVQNAVTALNTTTNNTLNDRVPNKFRWGFASGTTNGAGDMSFNHGLGGVPAAVVVIPHVGLGNWPYVFTINNTNGTAVNVRVFNTTNGNAAAGVTTGYSWFAAL